MLASSSECLEVPPSDPELELLPLFLKLTSRLLLLIINPDLITILPMIYKKMRRSTPF